MRGVSKSVPSGSSTLTILHPIELLDPDGKVVAITAHRAVENRRCSD